jgi:hypothetical protein
LRFFDGLPDADTVRKVYDNLDLVRGVDVFLNTMSAASALANIEGLKSVGCDMFSAVIHENRVDAKTFLLTPQHSDGDALGILEPERRSNRCRSAAWRTRPR